jgi:nodulation protein E
MSEPIVITGIGLISALGHNAEECWTHLIAGESGIQQLQGASSDSLRISIGAEVQNFSASVNFDEALLPFLDRHSQFALIAARDAVKDAGLSEKSLSAAAAIVGTGCGGKETDEQTYHKLYLEGKKRAHPLTIPKGMPSAAASQVSMQLGIQGPVFTVSSACASSNHAIAQAVLLIRSGIVDVAIAGGADAPFHFGLLKAWEAMRVVSSDTCRPFSMDRSGMVLGEGAGIVILESERHALKRRARIYAELAGFGMSSDAGHITDPSEIGASKAIETALHDAGINSDEIQYINAHGTGTQANDITETKAIRSVFKKHADNLVVSSTKSMHGHALGAAGAMELIATILAIKEGVIPPTANFTAPGEGCDLDYIPNTARDMRISHALSNSFAFGGLNAVIALRQYSS